MARFLFIGEKRSATAIARDWTWEDERLAGRTLADALRELGLAYGKDYIALNILDDEGMFHREVLDTFRRHQAIGWQLVALGKIAGKYLKAAQIEHLTLCHPAARGTRRKKVLYQAHVREVLSPHLTPPAV